MNRENHKYTIAITLLDIIARQSYQNLIKMNNNNNKMSPFCARAVAMEN